MAIMGINYINNNVYDNDESNIIKTDIRYKSVYIHLNNGDKHKFDTGDFVLDWYNAMKSYIKDLSNSEGFLSHSSSVNHFIMDGAPFDSCYLHIINDKPILKYLDRTDPDWWKSDIDNGGIEFFVKENTTPTWDELMRLCGDAKK